MGFDKYPIKEQLGWLDIATKILALYPKFAEGLTSEDELIDKIVKFAKKLESSFYQ
jgi:hypothetical protein